MGKAEAKVEQYLVKKVTELGGIAYKFTSPGRRNVPDRLCAFATGLIAFIECKAEGGELSKGQVREIERLTDLSQPVFIVSSKEEVDEAMALIISILLCRTRQAEQAGEKAKETSALVDQQGKPL